MPRHKKSTQQMRLAFIGDLTVSNILDWMIALIVVAIASFNIFQLGGVRAETMLLSVWMTAILVVFHGLWMLVSAKGRPIAFSRYGLLLTPLLAYILLHWLVLSPVGWEAHRDVIILLQAFILFWVVVNNFTARPQIWFIFAAIGLVGSMTILAAYNQYFRRPDWMPMLISHFEGQVMEMTQETVHMGRASGTLGAPVSYAGLMLLMLFPALVATFCKRFAAILRILGGFVSLMFISGIAMTQSISAIAAMSVGLLISPLFLAFKPRAKVLSFLGAIATVCIVLASLYYTSNLFNDRITALLAGDLSDPSFPLWAVAIKGFIAHPVFGQGMSSFGWLFEIHRPEGYNFDPIYAHSAYFNFLHDFGVIGLLLAIPAGWLLLQSLLVLKSQPQHIMLEQPTKMKAAPTKRMFLCAVLLSFTAFSIDALFQYHLHVPALLFLCAIYFGIAVKCLPARKFSLPQGKLGALSVLAGTVLIAIVTISISTNYLVARSYTVEGERRLSEAAFMLTERVPLDVKETEDTVLVFEQATKLNPENPIAWSNLAQARLNMRYVYPSRFESYGHEAEADIRRALEINSHNVNGWIILGTSLWMQGNYPASGEAFRHAVKIAPNNSIAWYHLAAFLNVNPDTRGEALTAIDRSIELKPNDAIAEDLRRKIMIP